MADYEEAPQVEKIAEELIDKYHPRLVNVNIDYVFRDKASKRRGKIVRGKARKVSNLYKELTGADFIIEIAKDEWFKMDIDEKKALIDHELTHCDIDEEGKPTLVEHDFTGFGDVLRRRGFWQGDLKRLKRQMIQMELPIDDPREKEQDNIVKMNTG